MFMDQETWTAVEDYLNATLLGSDPALDEALASSAAAELPAISVSPNQGKLLHLIARITGAKRILEIGTLGGYSTIWLARALPPGGRLVTLEADPKHADVAANNIQNAGLQDVVEIRLGPAADSLQQLVQERSAPFDFIFIDADKENNPTYLEWSLKLSRPGSVIVVDNVVREGTVLDAQTGDRSVHGVRSVLENMGTNNQLTATALQTVGSKGWDGFVLALVRAASAQTSSHDQTP